MPVTPTPVFTQGVQTAQAVCTGANTTYNSLANCVPLFTAGPQGAVLYGLKALPRGSTGGALRCDLFSSPNGTTANFIDAANMANYTQSTTSAPGKTDFGYTEAIPRRFGPNEQAWVSTSIAVTPGVSFDAQYENL